MNRLTFAKFIREADSNYFYNNAHKNGITENIENLKNVPYFDDVYKYYKEFADNNEMAYLKEVTDYIIKKLVLSLSYEERKNLKTYAFYCGNFYSNIKKKEKIKKLNDDGFYKIKSDKKYDGKKVEFIVDNSDDMFGGVKKYKGKLKWITIDERLMAMEPRHRRTGWFIDSYNFSIYIKIL